jgi:hypothetical protein
MQEKPKIEKTEIDKITHHECGVLARDTKNEPKMQENLKSRKLKLGFYCIKKLEKIIPIHLKVLFWLYNVKD